MYRADMKGAKAMIRRVVQVAAAAAVGLSFVLAGIAFAEAGKQDSSCKKKDEQVLKSCGQKVADAHKGCTLNKEETPKSCPHASGGHKEGKGKCGHDAKATRKIHKQDCLALCHLLDMLDTETVPEGLTAKGLPKADADGDGQISQDEWKAFSKNKREQILGCLARRAPCMDDNGDGKVDAAEFAACKAKCLAKSEKCGKGKHPAADTDAAPSGAGRKASKAGHVKEHKAGLLKHSPKADTNGDGKLSDGELLVLKLKFTHDNCCDKSGHSSNKKYQGSHPKEGKGSCGVEAKPSCGKTAE
jgi:hypothetical protein